MNVNPFRSWLLDAAPTTRVEAASALARAYLYSPLDAAQRGNAVAALTAMLDDPSPLVRRALAEALADAGEAPHHIMLALADDQAAIAAIVLARSPVLTDAELIDCAAAADPPAQAAIAARPCLCSAVAAALAEIAAPEALVALAQNSSVRLPAFSVHRMVERHGENGALREALLVRSDLPSGVRIDLVAATARALAAFVVGRNWMSEERLARVTREAKDRAAITIADAERGRGAGALIAHLRETGQLTVGFILRAILCGKIELFRAALADLSGLSAAHVDGLVAQSETAGFAAIYRKAALPSELLPAFRIALQAVRDADWVMTGGSTLSRTVIERVLSGCAAINSGELDKLMVLLRRFEAEAARDEAREGADVTARRVPLKLAVESMPLRLPDIVAPALATRPVASKSAPRLRAPERREPVMLQIDMAAIAAELAAAA